MKNEPNKTIEPTNWDILEAMQKGFALVDERFEQVDARFEQIDERFEQVDKRFEEIDQQFKHVDEKFRDVQRSLDTLTLSMAELQEDFAASSVAVDDNSIKLIDHGKRISRLEKRARVA